MQILCQKRNTMHAKMWGEPNAPLYKILGTNLGKAIGSSYFPSKVKILEAQWRLHCI